ncbi:MAG: hypothetical protein AAB855_01520, partial [Patescibacteria group bacterium]
MPSMTPQFDAALDIFFSKLERDERGGMWRTCRFSGERFYIRPEDIAFYKKIRVPLPTLSPNERFRRRAASANSYHLFQGTSAWSGKPIISIYPPGSPYQVYEHEVWYGGDWDPATYGRDYELGTSFFEQFHSLQLSVPRPNLNNDALSVNSDYTNTSHGLKNCYLVFDQAGGENLYYHQCCLDNKNCIDCWALDYCDTCYGCKFSQKLYNCFFVEHSENCIDSSFLFDCRGCNNCFMSSGLRGK